MNDTNVASIDSAMDKTAKLIRILIPAVGGQGGGVLTEWLVQAFQYEDYDVQGIGLPGLSQRGGSTTYYIEAHPSVNEPNKRVIFSQYPVPGDVDVILAQEFLELGLILEQGYGSSEKTTIVSSTHRIYSTLEKMPVGRGIYSDESLLRFANAFSKRFIGLDALELAKQNGMDELGINAILMGSLAASGAIPVGEGSFLKAIEGANVAIANNIKAFRIGWDYTKKLKHSEEELKPKRHGWDAFVSERSEKLNGGNKEVYKELLSEALRTYPIHLKEIFAEAIFRLIDYQNPRYAEKYLNDIGEIFEVDKEHEGGFKVSENFSKYLALWMCYEDGIRVAELKIKPSRFKQIREEMRLSDDQVFRVIDYLKPDGYEIYGLLPYFMVNPIISLTKMKYFPKFLIKKRPMTFGQKPVTTSLGGFIRLWLITKLKFTRPWSYRYRKEHELLKKYKSAVLYYTRLDYQLGCLVSKSGSVIKGYGNVRRRTIDTFERFLDNVIAPLARNESKMGYSFKQTIEVGEQALNLISSSTDGIDAAEVMAEEVLQGKAA